MTLPFGETVWSTPPSTLGWWPVLDSITSVSLTVHPVFMVVLQNLDINAAKTITPTITAVGQRTAHGSAAKTVTPTLSPVIHLNPGVLSDALSVTPTLNAAAHRTAHASVALTVTPTFTAAAEHLYTASVSETITPTISAAAAKTRYASAAETVTPTVSPVAHLDPGLIHAAETVTPTLSPVIHLDPGKVSDSLTVTPTFSASVGKTRHISASLSVTPTFSAAATVTSPTIVGTNTSATTSVTIPTHQVGDLLLIWAYSNTTAAPPSVPSAGGTVPSWSVIDSATGANTNSSETYYFVATATTETSGTWSGAKEMIAVVVRGQKSGTPIGGHAESGSTTGGTAMVAPAVTLTNTDGSSVLLEFTGTRSITTLSAAPSGYTRQVATADNTCCLNTKNATTSDGAMTQTITNSSTGYRGATVEILAH